MNDIEEIIIDDNKEQEIDINPQDYNDIYNKIQDPTKRRKYL